MKKILAGYLIALVFSSAVLAADGEAIYKSRCQICHGVNGKGTVMAPAFKGNAYVKTYTEQQISEIIVKGRSGAKKIYKKFAIDMPPQKLSGEEIMAVVTYIKSLSPEVKNKK